MRLKWDFHELFDFGDKLADLTTFESACKKAVTQIAKELHEMLYQKTPVKTGQLAAGWGGSENYGYVIKELKTCYKVELINQVPYALSVNDGHYSHNQFNKGGQPYIVKHRTVPYTQGNNDDTFVFGHFFVEKSILELENSTVLTELLQNELYKWFRGCLK